NWLSLKPLIVSYLILSLYQNFRKRSIQDYFGILTTFLYTILPIVFNLFLIGKVKNKNQFLALVVANMILIASLLYSHNLIKSSIFKSFPKQQFCGLFTQEVSISENKSTRTYWYFQNQQQQLKLNKDFAFSTLEVGDQVCIDYSQAEHWGTHIWQIYVLQKRPNDCINEFESKNYTHRAINLKDARCLY
ncbi:hypothetical protein ACEYX6_06980, partial [Acinetobacter sp. c2-A9]|uniref:hypothetical protein n=1 Tax=Acinetobacter sp. c2-A9 TaxID=3342802 RepID=UPI0035B90DAF